MIANRKGVREEHRIALIVCEGTKTEPQYLDHFRGRRDNTTINIKRSGNRDPLGIVKCAVELAKHNRVEVRKDDTIWCVFDMDTCRSGGITNFGKAMKLAKQRGIRIILSNPCFEIWFVLHYANDAQWRDSAQTIDYLKNFIPEYQKNMDVFTTIEDLTQIATDAARSRYDSLGEIMPTEDQLLTPFCNVYEIVEFLNGVSP